MVVNVGHIRLRGGLNCLYTTFKKKKAPTLQANVFYLKTIFTTSSEHQLILTSFLLSNKSVFSFSFVMILKDVIMCGFSLAIIRIGMYFGCFTIKCCQIQ